MFDAFVLLLAGGACKEVYDTPRHATMEECREAFLAVAWSGGNLDLVTDRRYERYLKELISDRRGEVFFRTAEGHVGTSPVRVRQGDIVAVLVGGNEPFVLRPVQTEGSDSYLLVGPCFLQGVMFGEALFGQLPEQWVCERNQERLGFYFRHRQSGELTWEDPRLWPFPSPWKVHFCDISAESNTCNGECIAKLSDDVKLGERHFFNTETQRRRKHDPRLDLVGLENGGIILDTYILV